MKITKRGIPQGERQWKGVCHSCWSEAEAKESELNNINHSQKDGSFSWEVCSVCGAGSHGYTGGMVFRPNS